MAQFQYPDIAGSVFAGYDFGNRMRQQRDAEKRQSALSALASQAYGAPRDQQTSLLSQMASVSPQAAAQQQEAFQNDEDRRNKTMVNMAKMLVAAPKQARAALYRQMLPTLGGFGLENLPSDYTNESAPTIDQAANALVQAYGGMGDTNELKTFNVMSQGLTPDQVAEARQIALGLKPRAVTGATKFGEFTDRMGRTRPQRNNPSTGSVEIYYDESGQWVPLGGQQQASLPPLASNGANYGSASPADPQIAEIERELGRKLTQDDFRQISAGTWQAQAPVRVPGLGVSRTPEEQAYLTTTAEQQAKLGALPQQLAIETQDAVNRAGGVTSAQEAAKREGEVAGREQKRTRDANETLVLLDEAEKLLPSATSGGLEAMRDRGAGFAGISTKGAQSTASLNLIASKLVAAVPRFEGPQSNIDVQFYREAAGDLANPQLPVGTRMAALETMRTLQNKYAGQGSVGGTQKRRLKYNPATGRIE